MARGDIWLKHSCDLAKAQKMITKANGTAMTAGEFAVLDGTNDGYVKTTGATNITLDAVTIVGLCVSNDTQTTSADGVVWVVPADYGTVFTAKANNASNLAAAIRFNVCPIDATSSVYTVDEDSETAGVAMILDYDSDKGTVDFVLRSSKQSMVYEATGE